MSEMVGTYSLDYMLVTAYSVANTCFLLSMITLLIFPTHPSTALPVVQIRLTGVSSCETWVVSSES